MTDFGICDKDHMITKAKNLLSGSLQKKSVSPILEEQILDLREAQVKRTKILVVYGHIRNYLKTL